MLDPQTTATIEQTAHDILEWVGFGTLIGLSAKAVMPGRDPGGAIVTLLMGIAGCVIGCGVLMFFRDSTTLTPISPTGFGAGTLGALILLFFYRLLSGTLITESEDGEQLVARRNRRRRKEVLLREGN